MKMRVLPCLAYGLTLFGFLPSAFAVSIIDSSSILQNFDGIGSTSTASLPADWKFSAAGASSPTYAAVGNFTATSVAASSGSPTTGGRYNWATSAGTDRAIGFMTSGGYASPNSIMLDLQNNSGASLTGFNLSFDVERYRINTAAASIQFYTSTDGSTWTSRPAGDISAATIGTAASAYNFATPAVFSVSGTSITGLSVADGGHLYLRWNFNTTGANSQGLALDNFSFAALLAGYTYWDTNSNAAGIGGSDTWTTSSTNWNSSSAGTIATAAFNPGNIAVFGGTAGNVSIAGGVTANGGIVFDVDGYTIQNSTLTIGTSNSVAVSNGPDTATINSQISGTTGLNKGGSGTLVLGSSDNDFTGNVTVSGGILSASSDGNLGNIANDIVLGGGGALKTTASVSLTSGRDVSGTGSLDIAPSTTTTVNGAFATTALTLSNTGVLDLQGGTRSVGSLIFTGGGTLQGSGEITASGLTGTALTSTATVTADTKFSNIATFSVDVGTGGTISLQGAVSTPGITSGNSSMRKTGAGTLELYGANAGLYRVQIGSASTTSPTIGGVVKINNNQALGANQVFLNVGTLEATTDLTGANALAIGVSISGLDNGIAVLAGSDMEFQGASGIRRIGGAQNHLTVNNTTTIGGAFDSLSGDSSSGFTLDGTGKLIVDGNASAMTLTTTIAGNATLAVNNNWGGAINVTANGKLQGNGTVAGTVGLVAGTILAPGNSIGSLSTGGNLNMAGMLEVQYNSSTDGIDTLIVGGVLDLTGAMIDFFDLANSPVPLDLPAYKFVDYGTLAGENALAFPPMFVPAGYIVDFHYNDGSDSNNIALVPVPEPSGLVLTIAAALGLLGAGRRTRNGA